VRTNADLEACLDTSDDWIRERTGIRERRVAAPDETTATMCTRAAEQALSHAGMAAKDLELIVCASTTHDHLMPATACLIQRALGAERAGAFDLNAACTGSLCALITGAQFIRSGMYRRVLVVAGETLSRFLDPADRSTCVLMGDGAGAFVLEATETESGVLYAVLGSRGDTEGLLSITAGGSARPASTETVAGHEHYLRMSGQEVFRRAVRGMSGAARETLRQAGLTTADLGWVVPHQANLRIIEAVRESLDLPREKLFVNIDRYGNTGAASIPIALSELADRETLFPGDHLLLVAFGGGLTWGATLVRWAERPTRRNQN
jgi:3-oxoacyl-[acyl-carrier-protein] synthase-3